MTGCSRDAVQVPCQSLMLYKCRKVDPSWVLELEPEEPLICPDDVADIFGIQHLTFESIFDVDKEEATGSTSAADADDESSVGLCMDSVSLQLNSELAEGAAPSGSCSSPSGEFLPYPPEPDDPASGPRVLIPKLDFRKIGKHKKTAKSKLLAFDVASLLDNTFTVNKGVPAVRFETIKEGDTSVTHRQDQRPQRRHGVGSPTPTPTQISFTGPGFAALPPKEDDDDKSNTEESVRLNRRMTMLDGFEVSSLQPQASSLPSNQVLDAAGSERGGLRDYSLLFDESNITGMFKSKRDRRRRNPQQSALATPTPRTHKDVIQQASPDLQRELRLFHNAYLQEDARAIIKLLDSTLTLPPTVVDQIHPWAEKPESIAALAASELAVLAHDKKIKADYHVLAIQKLAPLLKASERDKYEAALLALGLLVVDSSALALELMENDGLAPLISLMYNSKDGVKASAAQLARNIFVLDVRHRRLFRDLGGIHALFSLLDGNSVDLQLEALFHMEDLILQNGEELTEFVDAAKILSVGAKLEALLETPDDDLHAAARQLYLRLAD